MLVYGGAKHNLYSSSTFIEPLYSPISEDDSHLVGCLQQSRLKDCQGCAVIDGEIHSLRHQCWSMEERNNLYSSSTFIEPLYSPISEDDSHLVGCPQQSRLKDCQGCAVIDGEIRFLRHQCRSMEEGSALLEQKVLD